MRGQRYADMTEHSSSWNHLRLATPMLETWTGGFRISGADVADIRNSAPELLTKWINLALSSP